DYLNVDYKWYVNGKILKRRLEIPLGSTKAYSLSIKNNTLAIGKSETNSYCTGRPYPCSHYGDAFSCNNAGCRWTFSRGCTGSPFPCGLYDSMISCKSHGCSWVTSTTSTVELHNLSVVYAREKINASSLINYFYAPSSIEVTGIAFGKNDIIWLSQGNTIYAVNLSSSLQKHLGQVISSFSVPTTIYDISYGNNSLWIASDKIYRVAENGTILKEYDIYTSTISYFNGSLIISDNSKGEFLEFNLKDNSTSHFANFSANYPVASYVDGYVWSVVNAPVGLPSMNYVYKTPKKDNVLESWEYHSEIVSQVNVSDNYGGYDVKNSTVVEPILEDKDGDGYYISNLQPYGDIVYDFNDNNPTAYPGAPELCYDGVDNDGDGKIDSFDPDCFKGIRATIKPEFRCMNGVSFYYVDILPFGEEKDFTDVFCNDLEIDKLKSSSFISKLNINISESSDEYNKFDESFVFYKSFDVGFTNYVDVVLVLRVNKDWIFENKVAPSSIKIYGLENGALKEIKTVVVNSNDEFYFYETPYNPIIKKYYVYGKPGVDFWFVLDTIQKYYHNEISFSEVVDVIDLYYS
ncbi:MAG: hypothetical protein J7K22_03270, partial [Nanoarchaeota archaeon]|nr:hypothetical protein [Nanoarchaeota archaeon]